MNHQTHTDQQKRNATGRTGPAPSSAVTFTTRVSSGQNTLSGRSFGTSNVLAPKNSSNTSSTQHRGVTARRGLIAPGLLVNPVAWVAATMDGFGLADNVYKIDSSTRTRTFEIPTETKCLLRYGVPGAVVFGVSCFAISMLGVSSIPALIATAIVLPSATAASALTLRKGISSSRAFGKAATFLGGAVVASLSSNAVWSTSKWYGKAVVKLFAETGKTLGLAAGPSGLFAYHAIQSAGYTIALFPAKYFVRFTTTNIQQFYSTQIKEPYEKLLGGEKVSPLEAGKQMLEPLKFMCYASGLADQGQIYCRHMMLKINIDKGMDKLGTYYKEYKPTTGIRPQPEDNIRGEAPRKRLLPPSHSQDHELGIKEEDKGLKYKTIAGLLLLAEKIEGKEGLSVGDTGSVLNLLMRKEVNGASLIENVGNMQTWLRSLGASADPEIRSQYSKFISLIRSDSDLKSQYDQILADDKAVNFAVTEYELGKVKIKSLINRLQGQEEPKIYVNYPGIVGAFRNVFINRVLPFLSNGKMLSASLNIFGSIRDNNLIDIGEKIGNFMEANLDVFNSNDGYLAADAQGQRAIRGTIKSSYKEIYDAHQIAVGGEVVNIPELHLLFYRRYAWLTNKLNTVLQLVPDLSIKPADLAKSAIFIGVGAVVTPTIALTGIGALASWGIAYTVYSGISFLTLSKSDKFFRLSKAN